jgi:osmotically-inducible protein OsmY
MNIARKSKGWTACIYATTLALGLDGISPQVNGQDAPTAPAARSNTGGSSTSPESAAVVNRKLRERVRAALHAEPFLYDRHIDVTVEGNAVVLSGIVFSDWDLLDALRIAREAAGNRPVVDNLSLEREFRR